MGFMKREVSPQNFFCKKFFFLFLYISHPDYSLNAGEYKSEREKKISQRYFNTKREQF